MHAQGNGTSPGWNQPLVRGLVLVSTVVLAWAILTIGAASGEVDLREGELATRNYIAQHSDEVVDQNATQALQDAAAEQVESVTSRDASMEQQVNRDLSELFAAVRSGVLSPVPEWVETLSLPPTSTTTTTTPTITTPTTASTPTAEPSTTTSSPTTVTEPASSTEGEDDSATPTDGETETGAGGESEGEAPVTTAAPTTAAPPESLVSTPLPPARVTLTGRVFLDFDSDGAITESGTYPEVGLELMTVRAISPFGEGYDTFTQSNGDFSLEVPEGVWEVVVDSQDADLPPGFTIYLPSRSQQVVCLGADSECPVDPVPFLPLIRPIQLQNQEILRSYPQLNTSSVATLVEVAADDVIRQVSADRPRTGGNRAGRPHLDGGFFRR